MSVRVAEFDQLREQLQAKLLDYLRIKGVQVVSNGDTKFRCINPAHADAHPSAHIVPRTDGKYWCCFSCLNEDELVWTDRGLVRIGDVAVGMNVLSHTGAWREVSRVTPRGEKDLWAIETANFRRDPLETTPDHPYLIVRGESLPDGVPYVQRDKERGTKFYGRLKRARRRISRFKGKLEIVQAEAKDVLPGDYVLFPRVPEANRVDEPIDGMEAISLDDGGYRPWRDRVWSLPVDPSAAWLYGVWLAEGSISEGRILQFTFGLHEKETLAKRTVETVESLFGQFGISSSVRTNEEHHVCNVTICSTDLCRLFEHAFGKGCSAKRLPAAAMNWTVESQLALLTGFIEGDAGCTTSRSLAYGLFALAVQCRKLPSTAFSAGGVRHDGINRRDAWILELREMESLRRFYEPIDGVEYLWSAVTSSKPVDGRRANVVDITVDGDSSFVAKIGAVHNCGARGDLFDAAHYLEGLPVGSDEAFYTTTVPHLAELFQIPFRTEEMTEEEELFFRARRAYQMAAQLLAETPLSEKAAAAVEARGWSAEDARKLGIGQVAAADLAATLEARGFDQDFLEKIDLVGPNARWMFGADRLLFTWYDAKGRPIGFTSRNLDYDKGKDGEERDVKYRNTKGTILFNKGRALYGIEGAVAERDREVYVFEGQADVASYRMKRGMHNCIALGGTAFTDRHVDYLKELGVVRLCLCLDGDDAGRRMTREIVSALGGNPGLSVSVLTLPSGPDEKDVDSFLRTHGIEGWDEARKTAVSAFSWRLRNRLPDDSVDSFVNEQIGTILNEGDPLVSWRLIEELSAETDIPIAVLKEQVDFRRDSDKALLERKRKALADQFANRIQANPEDGMALVARYQQQLEVVEKTHKADYAAPSYQRDMVRSLRERQLKSSSESYIKLGWPIFDGRVQGLPAEDIIMFVGGKANVGKTSLFAQWSLDILRNNADTIVVNMTIDDSAPKFIPRLVSNLSKLPTHWISRPNSVCRGSDEIPAELLPHGFENRRQILEAREKAYDAVEAYMAAGQLRIVDVEMTGGRWAVADKLIHRLRRKYPTAKIVLFLDNFHNLQDFSDGSGPQGREKFAELSQLLRNTATRDRILIFSTIEYTKLQDGTKPTNNNLAESRRMEYVSDAIVHLVNHSHEFRTRPGQCHVYWFDPAQTERFRDEDGGWQVQPIRKPTIELMFGKSKISSFKGSIFADYDPDICTFAEAPPERQRHYLKMDQQEPWNA